MPPSGADLKGRRFPGTRARLERVPWTARSSAPPRLLLSASLIVEDVGTIDAKGIFLDGGQEYYGLGGG